MEQLDKEQLKVYNNEYVNSQRWRPISRCIDKDFSDGEFTFLDLGGGNGLFADRVLEHYPKSAGVVLDNSRLLLDKNKPHSRKRTVLYSVEFLNSFTDEKYDLIFFNWVLHHLVGKSYFQSRENINRSLRSAVSLLTDKGRISIYDNMYNGLIIDAAPSWIIYHLTSAKSIAKLVKKGGANTAGIGVCFLSYKQWCSVFSETDICVLDYTGDEIRKIPWTWNVALHIGHTRWGHFWLKRPRG